MLDDDGDGDDDTGAFELISVNVSCFDEATKLTKERETFYTMKRNLPTATGPWWTATAMHTGTETGKVKRGERVCESRTVVIQI